jgi:galactokinase
MPMLAGSMSPEEQAAKLFLEQFGEEAPLIVQAPGRICLIGGHTDYNKGFVLPMAIDRRTVIAARPRPDRIVAVSSSDFPDTRFDLGSLQRGTGWAEYLKGIAWSMGADSLPGWEGVVVSTIPLGASLSSSAALEVATALTFVTLANQNWDPIEAALMSSRAENSWVGVSSGIMDQLISAGGRADHAILIDCRDLSQTPVPLPAGVSVVVLDTGTRRQLTESDYNQRRDECTEAAQGFGVASLRDLTMPALNNPPRGLSDIAIRRARHIVGENERTLAAADAMIAGDPARLGELISQAHVSLRDNFEVSSPALDAMVQAAQSSPGCLGASMTGAGFAGCAIALVEELAIDSFIEHAEERYRNTTDHTPALFTCRAAPGASVVTNR